MTRRAPDLHEIDAPDLWPDIERRIAAQRPTPIRSGARVAGALAVAALLAGLLAWALFGLRGLGDDRTSGPAQPAPGTPASLDFQARTWVVPEEKAAALIERQGGEAPVIAPYRGANAIVVRLSWTPQAPEYGDRLGVVVIDGPSHLASQLLFASPVTLHPSYGWDGRYQDLAERYPWLAPTADVQNPDGSVSDGAISAYFDPVDQGPMWIVARFPRSAGILPPRADEPPVVGVFLPGPDEHALWAVRPTSG